MLCVKRYCVAKYKIKQIADIVLDVESYPLFLPWCVGSKIIDKTKDSILADLVIAFKGMTITYRSNVTWHKYKNEYHINADLVEGPFKSLHNKWVIRSLNNKECEIFFDLDFELKIGYFAKLLAPFFEEACHKMLEAFEDRAKVLYES